MENVLPCPLRLLLLLALSPGGTPSPTLAQDCSAADTVVKKGTTQLINNTRFRWDSERNGAHLTLFVKPESDFKGVSLYAQTPDGTIHAAWLPAKAQCFPRNGKWLEFFATVNVAETGLEFGFVSAACWEKCKVNTDDQGRPKNFKVEAYGHSRWLTRNPPADCDMEKPFASPLDQMYECMHPPYTTTTTTTNTTATITLEPCSPKIPLDKIIIILPGVVVPLVVVVVVVVAVFSWKRKVVKSSNVVRFQPQPAVSSRPLQPTTCQGHAPDQDNEHVYYEILPDLSTRRAVVPEPAQDSEDLVYDDVLPPRSPLYENVPPAGGSASPHWHLDVPGVRDSQLYATVL